MACLRSRPLIHVDSLSASALEDRLACAGESVLRFNEEGGATLKAGIPSRGVVGEAVWLGRALSGVVWVEEEMELSSAEIRS